MLVVGCKLRLVDACDGQHAVTDSRLVERIAVNLSDVRGTPGCILDVTG